MAFENLRLRCPEGNRSLWFLGPHRVAGIWKPHRTTEGHIIVLKLNDNKLLPLIPLLSRPGAYKKYPPN